LVIQNDQTKHAFKLSDQLFPGFFQGNQLIG
jgi:hypothetical protein